jgi:hypothetical protein
LIKNGKGVLTSSIKRVTKSKQGSSKLKQGCKLLMKIRRQLMKKQLAILLVFTLSMFLVWGCSEYPVSQTENVNFPNSGYRR